MSVNHVQNRLAHKSTNLSPYEALFERKPTVNYFYFKILAQQVYILNSDLSGKKTKPKFEEAILLGYDENSHQYKVWNVGTGKFQLSRNIKFCNDVMHTEEIDNIEIDNSIFILKNKIDDDNLSLSQVLNCFDRAEWQISIKKEYDNLIVNDVLELLPHTNQRCLNVIPLFKVKQDEIGHFKSRKTRYVVQGFKQKEGIDYHETYAPVSNYSSLLTLLNIVVCKQLECHQVDFDFAFLNATLHEDIVSHFMIG